jgi:hypothetical protein
MLTYDRFIPRVVHACLPRALTRTLENSSHTVPQLSVYLGILLGRPLWSSGQFLATDPEVHVRFPVLPDFLRSRIIV